MFKNQTKWSLVAASLLMLAVAMTACGGGGGSSAEAIAAGRAIYETGGDTQVPCLTCHTLDGTTLVGPSFQGLGERAGSRVPGLSAEEYLRQSILSPQAFVVPEYEALMPTIYGETFSDEDINNLVAFLLSQ